MPKKVSRGGKKDEKLQLHENQPDSSKQKGEETKGGKETQKQFPCLLDKIMVVDGSDKEGSKVIDCYREEGKVIYVVQDRDGNNVLLRREQVMMDYKEAVLNYFEQQMLIQDKAGFKEWMRSMESETAEVEKRGNE